MDIKSGAIFFDILYPQIFILGVGMLILIVGNYMKSRGFIATLAVIGLVAGLLLSLEQWENPQSGFFGMVQVDNTAIFFYVIFITAGILTILMSRSYLVTLGIERFEYYALILFSTAGMMTMASSSDLVVIFLGLEIMSVPLYVLAGFARHDIQSNEAGIKYFIMGAFATGFLVYGIALIYGASGTTDLRRIMADFSFLASHAPVLTYSGAVLILIGFAFKVAAVPFHMWVPDVYQGAPTPVTGYFSVAPKAAGFAALMRIFLYGFADMESLTLILYVMAVLTMTVGNIMALLQSNIKRMLAYSSIAHAGYILVGLTAGGEGALSSILYYLAAYMFFNLGAFAVVTLMDSRAGSTADIGEINGMADKYPYLAAVFALFMFALAGFPPTAGFFGKFYIFSEAVKGGFVWLTIIAVMNSFVSVYYYLRPVVAAYFGPAEKEFSPVAYRPGIIAVLLITALGTVALGFFPGYVLEISRMCMFPFM